MHRRSKHVVRICLTVIRWQTHRIEYNSAATPVLLWTSCHLCSADCNMKAPLLQVVERWVQAAPMHALLRQPRLPPSGAEADAPTRPDSDDESAVDPTSDCIVSAVLEMAFAGVALLLPEADAKGRRIFSLAYEDPPSRDCRQLLGAALPRAPCPYPAQF